MKRPFANNSRAECSAFYITYMLYIRAQTVTCRHRDSACVFLSTSNVYAKHMLAPINRNVPPTTIGFNVTRKRFRANVLNRLVIHVYVRRTIWTGHWELGGGITKGFTKISPKNILRYCSRKKKWVFMNAQWHRDLGFGRTVQHKNDLSISINLYLRIIRKTHT